MKYHFKITFLGLIALFFIGCYGVPKIETQEVYIPSPCPIDMPSKPVYKEYDGVKYENGIISKNYSIFLKNEIDKQKKYIYILETALKYCILGEMPK